MTTQLNIATMSPMLARSVAHLPEGPRWRYEPRYDGLRALVAIDASGFVRIVARSGRDASSAFPELRQPPRALLDRDAVLDTEIVAVHPNRTGSTFDLLQRRLGVGPTRAAMLVNVIPVQLIALDILELDGVVLTNRPLKERLAVLETLVTVATTGSDASWQRSEAIDRYSGSGALTWAIGHGYDGAVARDLEAPYLAGQRTSAFQAATHVPREDFVIVGWRPAADDPARPGALALATRNVPHAPLHFAGWVSSGIGVRERELLHTLFLTHFSDIQRASDLPRVRDLQLLRPTLVADVRFTGLDEGDSTVRGAHFLGIRPDRDSDDVVREPRWN
jgi:bifunctional non-homologous end joining protein LigD